VNVVFLAHAAYGVYYTQFLDCYQGFNLVFCSSSLHLQISNDIISCMGKDGLKRRFFTKKKIILFITIVVLFFIVKSIFFSPKNASVFTTVKKGDIKEELTLSGQINAEDHVILSFGTPGKTIWVGIKEGDWVKKGQEIAALDTEVLAAALRQAWQSFTAAKAASDKYYDGRDPNKAESYDQKIERTTLDTAKNNAYDNVRIAQENLKNADIYSPIAGLATNVSPNLAGVNVSALNSSYEIVNPSTIYVKVTADQTEVGSVKEGQIGTIIFDSYPDQQITGTIKEISFAPDSNESGTVYDIKVVLSNVDNSSYKYRLGMTADVGFVIKEDKNVLIVPSEYVKSDNNGKYVLVGQNKKKTYIKTAIENDTNTEVKKGLLEGDVIYD
jgi:RND family efflux transporter MFP subunit